MTVTDCFLNLDFRGRARRAHYWANLACWAAVATIVVGAGRAMISRDAFDLAFVATLILAGADQLAMIFRRAHDTGRSGWIWLLLPIPLVNFLPLYWLLIEDGQRGANRHGPPVKHGCAAMAAAAQEA